MSYETPAWCVPLCVSISTVFVPVISGNCCLLLQEKKESTSKEGGKSSIDDSAFEALEKDFQDVSVMLELNEMIALVLVN